GVSLEQIKAMTPAQLKDYIDHGTIPIIATEAFVEDCAGNIYKSDISTLAREYGFSLPDEVLVQQELSGQVGYRGVVIGKVGIVRTKEDLHKIDTGDILVSPMTTPDFLPAMQRAAAFVTDEGGVLCHAAIVSREMKKPCVIGTKIATKILKDGDLVEVDGNNGIVKIKKEGAA
ncbi:hypothetical protein HGA64_04920, partial [Candidatus Falkowbacteria bacterium]|nr:hypothetical protein [Candidatus Falkowbacteria bacterium]